MRNEPRSVASPARMSVTEAILAIGGLLWGVALIVIFQQAPLYSGASTTSVITESCTGTANSQTCSGSGFAPASVDAKADADAGAAESVTEAHTTATLTEVNGRWVLAYAIGPLLMVVIVCIVLWERPVARGAGAVAWTVTGLLGGFTLLAMMSIGVFLMPLTGAAIALCVVRQTRAGSLAQRYGPPLPTGPHA